MRTKKSIVLAWALYDLSDTAFSALFVTFFFPLFITQYLGGDEFQFGLVMGISMLLAGFIVPYIGAISDATGRKMPFIIVFSILCAVFTVLVGYSGLGLALFFGLFANLFYHVALDIYDSVLVDISTKKNIGMISGFGTALGYVGTILSLGMAFIILGIMGWDSYEGVRMIFPATALFYLFFAAFLFFFVKDKQRKKRDPIRKALYIAFHEFRMTFHKLGKHKGLLIFLISSFFFNDAINTAIMFLYLYGKDQIGLDIVSFFYIFAIMAVAAGFGSLLFGRINDRLGPKKTIIWLLLFWIAVIFLLMRVNSLTAFVIAGCIGGIALGGIWTVVRPMLVEVAPRKNVAQFFGFQGLTEKFSGVLGPVIFGFMVVHYSYAAALWVLLAFFVIGLITMINVPQTSSSIR